LSAPAIRCFNACVYHRQGRKSVTARVHYDPFLYPLDSIHAWNRIYGSRGFYQYQCVVPREAYDALRALLAAIDGAGGGSFLAVLKEFGPAPSVGMLSFPREGITLALDFPNRGAATLELLDRLDDIVIDAGGAVYAAKDARMSPRAFAAYYPQWRDFERLIDPRFSSTFWRRVTRGLDPHA
jgi:FAD/FMN-containing dehydrogenase